jgi:biopolymer transport protein ExbD
VVRTADGVEYRIGSRVARSREELRAVLAALPRDAGVAIRARRDAPIGAIATVMQVAQDEGYVKRSYVPRDE